jgi:hypothetical protein
MFAQRGQRIRRYKSEGVWPRHHRTVIYCALIPAVRLARLMRWDAFIDGGPDLAAAVAVLDHVESLVSLQRRRDLSVPIRMLFVG